MVKHEHQPAAPLVKVGDLMSSVRQEFFPFSIEPREHDGFRASLAFKRGPGLSIGAVTIDPHVATVSRGNKAAMQSGMSKVLWIDEGEAEFEQGDWSWRLQPGQWAVYDVDQPYRFLSTTRTSFITMVCDRALLGPMVAGKPSPQVMDDVALLSRQFVRAALASELTLSHRTVNALAHGVGQCLGGAELVMEGVPATDHHQQLLDKARRYIERMLHDPALCPTMIASALCVSRRTLYAAFAVANEAPARAIQEARLRHAQQLLMTQPVNLTSLALHMGFSDAAHFSRTYKKLFGESPSATRDRASR
ncbi:MAG: helix-turn-helix domain-containing protein [Aquabacterium sp.]|jgi:AraC family transcriptional regulator, positive regulator of tynA and feaB|uniref:helix-turn-helix domain-containing protein n=1 Tax=Aquabacterium sp. TaxID=1872578 RepID=UPI003BB10186